MAGRALPAFIAASSFESATLTVSFLPPAWLISRFSSGRLVGGNFAFDSSGGTIGPATGTGDGGRSGGEAGGRGPGIFSGEGNGFDAIKYGGGRTGVETGGKLATGGLASGDGSGWLGRLTRGDPVSSFGLFRSAMTRRN